MTEHQKLHDIQTRGSRIICPACGTIYNPQYPETHPAEECDRRKAMIDADSSAGLRR